MRGAFAVAGCLWGAACAVTPAGPAPRAAAGVTLVTPEAPVPGARATVVVFLATDCPIANAYTPELARIVHDYTARDVAFLAVYCDPDTSATAARTHAERRGLDCPVALDHAQHLAARMHATMTPEAVVVLPDASVAYRGRIDDTWRGYQRRQHAPHRRDLRDALDAVLAGRAVEHAWTRAVGCPLPELPE